MQSIRVARNKLTELQPAFSSLTAFWQDHKNKRAVMLSLSKAQLKKKEKKKRKKKKRGA